MTRNFINIYTNNEGSMGDGEHELRACQCFIQNRAAEMWGGGSYKTICIQANEMVLNQIYILQINAPSDQSVARKQHRTPQRERALLSR